MDIGSAVPGLLSEHPLVDAVKLTGSRATGTAHGFSDWDFEVETRNFARVAEDLPALVAPLQPLAEQWDRYAPHACFMLILRGPTKVDLLFLDEEQAWAPPWEPTPTIWARSIGTSGTGSSGWSRRDGAVGTMCSPRASTTCMSSC